MSKRQDKREPVEAPKVTDPDDAPGELGLSERVDLAFKN